MSKRNVHFDELKCKTYFRHVNCNIFHRHVHQSMKRRVFCGWRVSMGLKIAHLLSQADTTRAKPAASSADDRTLNELCLWQSHVK